MAPPQLATMLRVHLVDMALYRRLRAEDPLIGAKRIARALGTGIGPAQSLLKEMHWQQDPLKVRVFNEARHTAVDEATGVASAEEMRLFGWTAVEKREAAAALPKNRARVGPTDRIFDPETDAVDRAIVEKAGDGLPARIDSQWFVEQLDRKLALLINALDPVVIGKMNGRELAVAIGTIAEKRALLRGEPTQIVSYENRAKLDALGLMVMEEMKRRGIDAPRVKVVEGVVN